jgi:hypothetical protein
LRARGEEWQLIKGLGRHDPGNRATALTIAQSRILHAAS